MGFVINRRNFFMIPLVTSLPARASDLNRRIALVVGNSNYEHVRPLSNPAKDALNVAKALERLGFEVDLGLQLQSDRLRSKIEEFGERLISIGAGATSFVFYAGHAAQDPVRVNYLMPIDAASQKPEDVRTQGVPIQRLLDFMEEANNKVNILVLDACRDWFQESGVVDTPKGIRDMGRHGNVLIALATSPDRIAADGDMSGSPYTKRLVEALSNQANDPLILLLDDVNSRVYADTDSAQSPEYLNGLARAPRWSISYTAVITEISTTPATNSEPVPNYLKSLDTNRLLLFTGGNVSFVETLRARLDLLSGSKINTPNRLAYFLGMISVETSGFRARQENLNYSARRLREVFPSRFATMELAMQYAGQPEKIANRVYGNRFGNRGEESGDGWKFRGRGLFMTTGRSSYSSYGRLIGVDLEEAPELLNDPEMNLAAAATLWAIRNLNQLADRDDLIGITRALVGGVVNIDARRKAVAAAKEAVALT